MIRLPKDIFLYVKNLVGWKTPRKIVVFAVDDYGNVRLASREARKSLDNVGLGVYNRFDALDTVETQQDLEALYDVLRSVKDKNDHHAVFTAYAVPCNIDFEKMEESGNRDYYCENLPNTFEKLSLVDSSAYKGAWNLWQEGIKEGILVPQFHGREHINLKVFEEKLQARDHELMACLKNRSFTSLSRNGQNTISPMAAFDFWSFSENDRLQEVLVDGLDRFEKVFGYRANNFTPPVYRIHPVLYPTLRKHGIRFMDTAMLNKEHKGKGKFRRSFNYTGKWHNSGIRMLVRNVVFEPTIKRDLDWSGYALKQIETAFRFNRPAIVSSHRVNFCGYIDEKSRRESLRSLKTLLKNITQKWPEVEFMSASNLGKLIESKK